MTDALLGTTGWVIREPTLGQPPIAKAIPAPTVTANTSTLAAGTIASTRAPAGGSTPNVLGKIVKAVHPTYGEGEFIYAKGVASTLVGSLVTYNSLAPSTTLAPNTANLDAPVAVAMSVCTAGNYGWYQIAGLATILKTAVKVSPSVPLFLSATAGRVMSTVASGKQIMNAISNNAATVASATSTIVALIQRPFAQGQKI
ncbi:hypothetical protein ACRAVF_19000 [Bradyrhizobium oligotrophicum S58]